MHFENPLEMARTDFFLQEIYLYESYVLSAREKPIAAM